MGGFTTITLKDDSLINIISQNAKLELAGLRKGKRFYSEIDIILEYEAYKIGDGVFPEDRGFVYGLTLDEFKPFWSSYNCWDKVGQLSFDCYFGRTSNRAMRMLGKYLGENADQIKSVSGSFSTFAERGMTELERTIMFERGFLSADEV